MLDMNTFILLAVGTVFAAVGIMAWVVDSGVKEQYKAIIKYSLFAMFAALIGLFFLIKDDSEFEYAGWTPQEKDKKSSRKGGMALGGDGGGGQTTMSDDGGGGGELTLEEGEAAKGGGIPEEEEEAANGGGLPEEEEEKEEKAEADKGPSQDCPVCPLIVPISSGRALVGASQKIVAKGAQSGPASHAVVKSGFGIGKFEITVGEFKAFVDETGHRPSQSCRSGGKPGGNFKNPGFSQGSESPVTCVSWEDANAYTSWLTLKTNKTYRLPTEIEWEYAARAGHSGVHGGTDPLTANDANFADGSGKSIGRTTKVGSYPANGNNMNDVHGNVWEMTADCWSPVYAGTQKVAPDKVDCSRHIAKGGAWFSSKELLNFAMRVGVTSDLANNGLGFRVVRESDQPVVREQSRLSNGFAGGLPK